MMGLYGKYMMAVDVEYMMGLYGEYMMAADSKCMMALDEIYSCRLKCM